MKSFYPSLRGKLFHKPAICCFSQHSMIIWLFFRQMEHSGLYNVRGDVYSAPHCGGVAERLKAAVLKTADGQPSESSNLSSSAIIYTLYFCFTEQLIVCSDPYGGVAERLKAAVLKTADGQPSESSNLSSSAIFKKDQPDGWFFFCLWSGCIPLFISPGTFISTRTLFPLT